MSSALRRQRVAPSGEDLPVIVYDDGGSGILAACQSRFGSRGCDIVCDERHTVWIKAADGTRSVGLPPWQIRRRPMDELLDDVEAKLGLARS